jgi:PAS domain S-box-containing protein
VHKLFARQLAKATTGAGEVDLTVLGDLVGAAYEEMERDRRRTDRSLSLMVAELDKHLLDRERDTELLSAQKLQLDAALNNMSQGLCMFDADGLTVLYNERYLQITGYSAEFVSGRRSLLDRLKYQKTHGDFAGDPEQFYANLLKDVAAGKTITRVVHGLNGRILRVVDRPMSNGGWVATFEDITEQQQQEESFRLLFDDNALPMFVFDIESLAFLAVNDAALAHYGYSREQFLTLTALDLGPAECRADFIDKLKVMNEHQAGREWGQQKSDGSPFIAQVYSRRLQYHGKSARLVVVVDVTERVRAEQERDRNRELLDSVIENVTMTILVKDARSLQYVLVNRAAEKLWGLSRGEMIGKTPHEIFAEKTADLVEANDRKLLESRSNFYVPEHKLETRNGTRLVTTNRIAIRDQNGDVQYVLGVVDDVTERKQVEDQLRQAQKMEAVGNLTGGVAHDFNNLLTVVMGNLDLLREDVAGNVAAEQKIDTIMQASERGADLTRHMLAFSRRQPLQAKDVDVSALIGGTTRLLSRALGGNITIAVRTGIDLPAVLVDASQLETALLNIAINARDAMPDGGTLTLGTRVAELDADYAARHPGVRPGTYVAIEITDTGTGIPPDLIERIFDPFFTTKPSGKGTGLGLSMVYGFIKQSGGHIKVYSEVGQGTAFLLFLPLAAATDRKAVAKASGAGAEQRAGNEMILAVEDNPEIRATVVRQLRDLGYRVHEADNANTALQILDSVERVDLLFTDMILPGGLNGKELALKARAKRTDLKVLFTSGFPGTSDGHEARLDPGDVLLSKPYHKRELAKAIAEALDGPP